MLKLQTYTQKSVQEGHRNTAVKPDSFYGSETLLKSLYEGVLEDPEREKKGRILRKTSDRARNEDGEYVL